MSQVAVDRTAHKDAHDSGRLFRLLVLAAVLVSVVAFCIADRDGLLFFFSLPLIGVGWAVTHGGNALRLPRAIVHLMTLGAVAYVVSAALSLGVNVEVLGQFVVALIVVKAFDRHSPRDHALLLALAVFGVLAAAVTSNELAPAAFIVVFIPIVMAAVLLYQLEPPMGLKRSTGPALGRSMRRIIGVGGLGIGTIAVVVFLITPRGIGSTTFSDWGRPAAGAVTGFTDSIQLGRAGLISSVESVVMDVGVSDRFGESLGGDFQVLYLRGATMERYENGRWQSSARPSSMLQTTRLPPGVRRSIAQARPGATRVLDVSVRNAPSGSVPLFSLWAPVAVTLPDGGIIRTDQISRLAYRDGGRGRLRYSVECSPLPATQRRTGPRVPIAFREGVVADTARRVLIDAGIEPEPDKRPADLDQQAAKALEEYLRTNFGYTLDILDPGGLDPIEWFLTTAREGHCEYFASAHAAMCQSVGIPARVVSGYVGAEFNAATGAYVIRQSNAHAWVEALVGRGIWKTYDPTPPGDLARVHRPPTTFARRIRQALESVEHLWVTTVVSYDASARDRLLGGDSDATSTSGFEPADAQRTAHGRAAEAFAEAAKFGALLMVAIAVGAAVWFVLRRLFRSRANAADPRRRDEVLKALHAMLRRAGSPVPIGTPLLSHVRSTESLDPDVRSELDSIVSEYYAVRFGGRPASALAALRSRVRSIATGRTR